MGDDVQCVAERNACDDEDFSYSDEIKRRMETTMKKSLAVIGLILAMAGSYKLWADGSLVSAPGPVIAATGQNYFYPAAQSPTAGGLLVQDGIGAFRYSNAVVTTTNSVTVYQMPVLPQLTQAQILALTPATTGQMTMCTNCTRSTICISSAVVVGSWVIPVATGTFIGSSWSGLQACQ